MPNWCYSTLKVSGKKNELGLFADKLEEHAKFSNGKVCIAETFLPTPKDLLEVSGDDRGDALNPIPNWYDWRIDNWGSKWADATETYKRAHRMVKITHYTAWSPISSAIRTISRMFPELSFQLDYIEEGVFYAGVERYKNGEVTFEKHFNQNNVTDKRLSKPLRAAVRECEAQFA